MGDWTPEAQGVRINGWNFYWYHLFQEYFLELLSEVEQLAKQDPDGFHHHYLYKHLDCVSDAIENRIAIDPLHKDFLLGNTLGKQNRHWRRVKRGMPNRYRMFFQCRKVPEANVVIAWINDKNTLRKAGSRTDVYEVFKKMLKNGTIPGSIEELIEATRTASA